MVGFVLLGGLAMGLLAAVVLLPAYVDMAQSQYDRDFDKVIIAEMVLRQAANERLIAAVERQDPVVTRRLATLRLGVTPPNETMIPIPGVSSAREIFGLPPLPRPTPPQNWLIRSAERIERPAFRRGLLALGALAILAAMLCFSSPVKYPRKTTTS